MTEEASEAGPAVGRRRWSEEERRRIVAESFEPGASVSVVARRHDLNTNLLFTWRRRYGGEQRGDLLKVIWHDGQGACLFAKRLERGRFLWPSVAELHRYIDRPSFTDQFEHGIFEPYEFGTIGLDGFSELSAVFLVIDSADWSPPG
jgi:Transposase/IS66 Orf2 like protein